MRIMRNARKKDMMPLIVETVLDPDHLALVRGFLSGLDWQDGAQTAGRVAREVKRNEQADLSSSIGQKLSETLTRAVLDHPIVQAAAQPKQLVKLLVSKTTEGGGYGWHVDNAFMGTDGDQVRTDLSFTLFLSDPSAYEGGELEIEHAGQTQAIKAGAGTLVLYSSSSLHQVAPVTSGERLVCAGWIESLVPRADDREILFDLINLKAELERSHDLQSTEMLILGKAIANLRRRFN